MSRSLFARLRRRYGARDSGLTRREFLGRAAELAAALPLAGCASRFTPGVTPSRARRRVVVVGGGFAGLACARELRRAGADVVVLEARGRAGGRVLSFGDLVAGKTVEGGGEFIGENHPTWLAYANEFGLPLIRIGDDDDLDEPIILLGERLDANAAKALYDEMSEAYDRMTNDAATVDADAPWASANAATLDARSTAEWLDTVPISPRGRLAVKTELVSNNGAAIERQSYLGNLAQVKGGGLDDYWTKSEVFRCGGGNASLAQCLARDIGDERIRVACPVTQITVRADGVAIVAAGQCYEADHVVLAVPPSVWSRIEFEPALPALLRPQMGANVKWIAAVKSRFWRSSRVAPNALSDGEVCATWEPTDGQPGDDGAALTAFSGGPAAKACRAHDATSREAAYHATMEAFFTGFNASFVKSRFMDWPADEWTRASYSFPAPGQLTAIGPILQAGLPRLHFAGEHVCPAFVGYMEGALRSGVAVSKRLSA
ncbi:MAG: FAD-dependent oxidoreductase [Planctomycetes bacterium]|nr:FAD-dependent oxidoreductase [Planctomycetota bacterium]MBI3847578.1 FAD-dependent oxidoreductase [Planctomycetota bacterium]